MADVFAATVVHADAVTVWSATALRISDATALGALGWRAARASHAGTTDARNQTD